MMRWLSPGKWLPTGQGALESGFVWASSTDIGRGEFWGVAVSCY